MKFLGYNISLSKKEKNNAVLLSNKQDGKNRPVRTVIKKQFRREVSYQIADIKTGIQQAKNIDAPDRQKLLNIFEYVIKDGHLISQIRNAKFEVLSEPWMLYNGSTLDTKATEQMQKRWFNRIIEYVFEAE